MEQHGVKELTCPQILSLLLAVDFFLNLERVLELALKRLPLGHCHSNISNQGKSIIMVDLVNLA